VDLGVPPAAVQSAREEVFEKSCFFLGGKDGKVMESGEHVKIFFGNIFVGVKTGQSIWVMVDLNPQLR